MNVPRPPAIAAPESRYLRSGYPLQELFERLNNALTSAPVEITMKHKHTRFTLNNRAIRAQRRKLVSREKTHAVFYANVVDRRLRLIQASANFKRNKIKENPTKSETCGYAEKNDEWHQNLLKNLTGHRYLPRLP